MKNLLVLIFLAFTFGLFSQTRLDSLVLKEINDYRVSLKLNPVTFSKDCYTISKDHTTKLVETKDSLYHSKNFIAAEVVTRVSSRVDVNEKDIEVMLAKDIVNSWKKSPEHNRIITSPKYKFGGSSAIISSKKPKGFVLDENKKGKMFKKADTMTAKMSKKKKGKIMKGRR